MLKINSVVCEFESWLVIFWTRIYGDFYLYRSNKTALVHFKIINIYYNGAYTLFNVCYKVNISLGMTYVDLQYMHINVENIYQTKLVNFMLVYCIQQYDNHYTPRIRPIAWCYLTQNILDLKKMPWIEGQMMQTLAFF